MAPGLCIGRGDIAMAQATHGSAPDIAGTGKANPYAMIESTRMLIEWLGRRRGIPEADEASRLMRRGIDRALADRQTRTPDIRGTGDQAAMVGAILREIAA
jgi:3-isopropylmalate dehydrogenase